VEIECSLSSTYNYTPLSACSLHPPLLLGSLLQKVLFSAATELAEWFYLHLQLHPLSAREILQFFHTDLCFNPWTLNASTTHPKL
jgi:hypothetical protein